MAKRSLPKIRRFLNKMPQLAFRGTTEEHLESEMVVEKRGKISAEPNFFITRQISLKPKTRDIVKKLYSSMHVALSHVIGYSKMEIPSAHNNWSFGKLKTKPIILLAMDPNRKLVVGDLEWGSKDPDHGALVLSQAALVKGSRVDSTHAHRTGLSTKPFQKSDAQFVRIPITQEDLHATESALHSFVKEHKDAPGLGLAAINFWQAYLTKIMVQKSLVHIRANSHPARVKKK